MSWLYNFFERHKPLLWGMIAVSMTAVLWLSTQTKFEENIFQLLPETDDEAYRVTFTNLKLKDKIFVQAVAKDNLGTDCPSSDRLAEALDIFMDSVTRATSERHTILHTLSAIDPMLLIDAAEYAASHYPAYIDFNAAMLDSLTTKEHIREQLAVYQDFLDSETGENLYDAIAYDPCGIVYHTFSGLLPDGNEGSGFKNNHLYAADGKVCYGFITPAFGTDNSREASRLIDTMDEVRDYVRSQYAGVDILYHGTVILSGGNSKRMHTDIFVTVGVAMFIILLLLAFSLKRPAYILMIVCALGFGVVLALSVLYLMQGGMSLMSLGIGAIVLGVAFSYVLHVLVHFIYTGDIHLTLSEQTKPVLLGSLTTIGAFAGLLFTQSRLLNDFGFFALLVIVGTTLFSLIVMPHFLPTRYTPNKKIFGMLERINAYPVERSKIVCGLTLVWVVVCLIFAGRYTFDSDLKHIGYTSADCEQAQRSWAANINNNHEKQYFASVAATTEDALEQLPDIEKALDSLCIEGVALDGRMHVSSLLPSVKKQEERLDVWSAYFSADKQAEVWNNVVAACKEADIDADLFRPFSEMMAHPADAELLTEAGILPPQIQENLTEKTDDCVLVYFSVKATKDNMPAIKECLASQEGCMVMDPYYYTTDLVELIHDDFNLIMWISSAFVLLLLLLTYKNIWLTLIALSPMVLSWYTVLGAMALTGQSFNLANIIVSSFVFGIGVDYSIFILEGLLKGNMDKETMVYNKTAITISAVILIICMLILGFAQHPAINSISFASVAGMVTTIMLSYTLEPNLYKLYV
ncbi:MAG: MMPL family transporter, partial [Paludibacteraceae bacterium]|nr:MMPL family transporter [Paludibacteraceae bacterium]